MPDDGASGEPRATWEAVPWLLRVAALYSLCVVAVAAAVYLAGWLLIEVAAVSVAVIVALLLAALLQPVVVALRRARIPQPLAALGGVLTLLGIIGLTVAVVADQVADEFEDLGETVRRGLGRIRRAIVDGPLPVTDKQLDSLVESWRRWIETSVDPASSASTGLEAIAGGLLAIVLLFFLLKDGGRMWEWVLHLFPDRMRALVDEAGRAGWWTLGRYTRGTMMVAAVDAVGIGVALLVIGVPLVIPLALLTFVAAFVPIVGATVAGAAAALVALVANGPTDALLVLAAVIAVQQLEGNLLEPLIVGHAVRLHPAAVLVAVTAGTLLAGVAGAVIAVPILAVVYRMGLVLLRARRETVTNPMGPDPTTSSDHVSERRQRPHP